MKFPMCIKLALVGLATAALMIGCTKNRKSGGLMDDPETHFIQGKKYWDKAEYDRANDEFTLAKSLDKKYGPAYAGLAMVAAAKGDFEKAEDLADDAISKCDGKRYEGLMSMAIVIEFRDKGGKKEDWWEDAEEYYKKALKIAPKSGELLFRMGHMYKLGYEFRKAEDSFKANLEAKADYQEEANAEWKVVQDILRAEPGTRVGKKIALVEKITRADIAALFIAELELDRILDKSKVKNYDNDYVAPDDPRKMETEKVTQVAEIMDCDTHWARNFIMDIQKFQIRGLEPTPDHKWFPDEAINRGMYALFIEDILMAISGDKTLATKHLGTQSRFPDVNASSPYYNAICNAVDKNIMDASLNGEFRPLESVSGPQALLIIRSIKEMRR